MTEKEKEIQRTTGRERMIDRESKEEEKERKKVKEKSVTERCIERKT